MEFLVETLKNASLHIHAVWLAIAYIAVILAMAVAAGMMQVAAIKKQQQASQAQGYAEGKRDRLLPSHRSRQSFRSTSPPNTQTASSSEFSRNDASAARRL